MTTPENANQIQKADFGVFNNSDILKVVVLWLNSPEDVISLLMVNKTLYATIVTFNQFWKKLLRAEAAQALYANPASIAISPYLICINNPQLRKAEYRFFGRRGAELAIQEIEEARQEILGSNSELQFITTSYLHAPFNIRRFRQGEISAANLVEEISRDKLYDFYMRHIPLEPTSSQLSLLSWMLSGIAPEQLVSVEQIELEFPKLKEKVVQVNDLSIRRALGELHTSFWLRGRVIRHRPREPEFKMTYPQEDLSANNEQFFIDLTKKAPSSVESTLSIPAYLEQILAEAGLPKYTNQTPPATCHSWISTDIPRCGY